MTWRDTDGRNRKTDEELLESLAGLFIGQLDDDEIAFFNKAVRAGKATRSYREPAGLLGLGKVVVKPAGQGERDAE